MQKDHKKIVGPIYVLGGHPLSCRYIEDLTDARRKGEIDFPEISFIDPDSYPPAVSKFGDKVPFIHKNYPLFIEEKIRAHQGSGIEAGILIPDHSAPHVLFKVFLDLVRQDKRFSDRKVQITPFPDPTHPVGEFPRLPFTKTLDSGICAVSFATWTCPVDCEEPKTCPAIERTRDWNFNETFAHYTKDHHTDSTLSVHLFSCIQLARGIVMIPLDHIFHEWERLTHKLGHEKVVHLFVATFSKCHGIIGTAHIGG